MINKCIDIPDLNVGNMATVVMHWGNILNSMGANLEKAWRRGWGLHLEAWDHHKKLTEYLRDMLKE